MDKNEIVLGGWYFAYYGCGVIIGKCLAISESGVVLSFRGGDLFRGQRLIPFHRVLGEAEDPRWIYKLTKLFGR